MYKPELIFDVLYVFTNKITNHTHTLLQKTKHMLLTPIKQDVCVCVCV